MPIFWLTEVHTPPLYTLVHISSEFIKNISQNTCVSKVYQFCIMFAKTRIHELEKCAIGERREIKDRGHDLTPLCNWNIKFYEESRFCPLPTLLNTMNVWPVTIPLITRSQFETGDMKICPYLKKIPQGSGDITGREREGLTLEIFLKSSCRGA